MSYPHMRWGMRAIRSFRPCWNRIFDSLRYENHADKTERAAWARDHPEPRPMVAGDLFS